MKRIFVILMLAFMSLAFKQVSSVKMRFSPESEKYAGATKEYQDIWDSEGKRIIEAMERISGVGFTEREVQAIVYEGVSWSGS